MLHVINNKCVLPAQRIRTIQHWFKITVARYGRYLRLNCIQYNLSVLYVDICLFSHSTIHIQVHIQNVLKSNGKTWIFFFPL